MVCFGAPAFGCVTRSLLSRPVPATIKSTHPSPVTSAAAIARGASIVATSAPDWNESDCADTAVLTGMTSSAAVINKAEGEHRGILVPRP